MTQPFVGGGGPEKDSLATRITGGEGGGEGGDESRR